MKHSMTLIAVAAVLTLASCQKKAPEQQTTATTPPARAMTPTPTPTGTATQPALSSPAAATEEIGHYAENLYDWARTGDWAKAQADLSALKTALANLEGTGQATDPHGADELLAAIEKAVQTHDARALMHAANDMTRAAAEISRQFDPKVPVEVTLLDYYGRELELWAEEGNTARLNATRSKLRETWDKVRRAVVAKGGNTEAAQFDALAAQLAIAATPKDFTAVATPILDSVDALENVFNRG
jgi:ribosomal protein S20